MKNLDNEIHIRRALRLARRGEGKTSPNPLVGAVIVNRGKVVGEGYHKRAGGPHGEIEALKKAGDRARGGTLFVNLEPCCHFGRTPPCTDVLIAAGLKRVVIGMQDPNPLVRGRGIRRLKKAGIDVVSGILRRECQQLNEVFVKYIRTGLPFVILKAALSLDGKIATRSGESKWISGPACRKIVHELRDRVDAILVGTHTVVRDDPRLTSRLKNKKGKNPVRVILDRKGRVPLTARVFAGNEPGGVIYVTGRNPAARRENELRRRGIEVWKLGEKNGRIALRPLMRRLGESELTSVLIEGGGELHAGTLREKLADKVIFFIAPLILGGRQAPGPVAGEGVDRIRQAYKVKNLQVRKVGPDLMLQGYL